MRIFELVEDSAQNMNLIQYLSRTFMENIDIDYIESSLDHYDVIVIDNPFRRPDIFNKIEDILTKGKFKNPDALSNGIYDLEFRMNKTPYSFDSGGKQSNAAGTYDRKYNLITFYEKIENITLRIVAHELRHALQYYDYKFKSERSKKAQSKQYTRKPIELDAFWTDSFISAVFDYGGIDYDKADKKYILSLAKHILIKFDGIVSLDDKMKDKYKKKTIRTLYTLAALYEEGIEIENKELKQFIKKLDDEKSKKINDILAKMDKTTDKAEDNRLSKALLMTVEHNHQSMEKIPNYDMNKEPTYNVLRDVVPLPSKFHPRFGNFTVAHTLLYIALSGNKKVAEKYTSMLKKLDVDVFDYIYSFVETQYKDDDNQYAVLSFLRSFYNIG